MQFFLGTNPNVNIKNKINSNKLNGVDTFFFI